MLRGNPAVSGPLFSQINPPIRANFSSPWAEDLGRCYVTGIASSGSDDIGLGASGDDVESFQDIHLKCITAPGAEIKCLSD